MGNIYWNRVGTGKNLCEWGGDVDSLNLDL